MFALVPLIVLFPLAGVIVNTFFGRQLGPNRSAWLAVTMAALAFTIGLFQLGGLAGNGGQPITVPVATWLSVGDLHVDWAFQVDALSVTMMLVVTGVGTLIHVYAVGYMREDVVHNGDPARYTRFFIYLNLFLAMMLILVGADSYAMLFVGWEGVGLCSYLLIGFWFEKGENNIGNTNAAMKAFIVNRVGDLGLMIAMALLFWNFGFTLTFRELFENIEHGLADPAALAILAAVGVLFLVGAAGKSAQLPLFVWLPDAMAGPTPVSALIHAATMVTAGIFMVSRMSPLFEHSPTALGFITVIGATGALFLGILGMVQFDIKRVVAYSTLSQLGYMTVALGVSAYAGAMFHLMTHAFFKALLFLGAGSVIIAMHHNQDMRYMGGLRKYMPITYVTMLIGGLALCGIPPFAGFFSKDLIIEAVHESTIWGHAYAYWCVLLGVFVTSFYTFRLMFMTFHGKERYDELPADQHHDDHHDEHHGPPKESPWVVTLPLVLLAVPSILAGWVAIGPLAFGDYFGKSIFVLPAHDVLAELKNGWHGAVSFITHGVMAPPFWIALSGIAATAYLYLVNTALPARLAKAAGGLYTVLLNNYYFDRFNEWFFAGGARRIGTLFSRVGDGMIIEGIVNGSGRLVRWWGTLLRQMQSGYVYHYAFTMIIGLFALLTWWVIR